MATILHAGLMALAQYGIRDMERRERFIADQVCYEMPLSIQLDNTPAPARLKQI